MTILVIISGLVLLVTALGFLVAVSVRIKLDDRRRAYRSLRNDEDGGTLSNSGRRLVDLNFPEQPAIPDPREPREDDEGGAARHDRIGA
ncbi:hypothetical protein [Allosalinactinospora lopnorensis]|uniref:hypothetical protein n=1 Tax=Allosalinactinospora lopnorensis TaxID=1352348 RepID=UPI000623C5A4|nr:hypothetical protein [Allosalinactinospora lopnorensis]